MKIKPGEFKNHVFAKKIFSINDADMQELPEFARRDVDFEVAIDYTERKNFFEVLVTINLRHNLKNNFITGLVLEVKNVSEKIFESKSFIGLLSGMGLSGTIHCYNETAMKKGLQTAIPFGPEQLSNFNTMVQKEAAEYQQLAASFAEAKSGIKTGFVVIRKNKKNDLLMKVVQMVTKEIFFQSTQFDTNGNRLRYAHLLPIEALAELMMKFEQYRERKFVAYNALNGHGFLLLLSICGDLFSSSQSYKLDKILEQNQLTVLDKETFLDQAKKIHKKTNVQKHKGSDVASNEVDIDWDNLIQ